jgi:hypothetical protein
MDTFSEKLSPDVVKSPKNRRLVSGGTHPVGVPRSLPPDGDLTTTVTLRVRVSTIDAIATTAREQKLTMKQVICKALSDAGVSVAAVDLEDRTPRRPSRWTKPPRRDG